MSIWQDDLSVEALVAQRMGDEDWEDLIPTSNEGCSRRPSFEMDRDRVELEPIVDKYATQERIALIHNTH